MTFMRRFLPGLLLATLPGALAAQAVHGSGYTMVLTIDSGSRFYSTSNSSTLITPRSSLVASLAVHLRRMIAAEADREPVAD